MARLIYRLQDQQHTCPVIYECDDIAADEVARRFACDYWIKDGIVYETVSRAVEPLRYAIYVVVAEDEHAEAAAPSRPASSRQGVQLELREYREDTDMYPVIYTFSFPDGDEVLLYLQSESIMWDGIEWAKTSAEIDEDRHVYVYYAQPVPASAS